MTGSARRLRPVLLALIPALGACGGAGGTGTEELGAWGNATLVEEVRFGAVDGADEYVFGSVSTVLPLSDGSMLVADRQGPRLGLYDADGRFIRSVGQAGGGPGEYQTITGLQALPSGEVALFDGQLARITFFTAGGDLVRTLPLENARDGGSFLVDPDGNFLMRASRYVFRSVEGFDGVVGFPPEDGPSSILRRLTPDGTVIDSIFLPESRIERQPAFVLTGASGFSKPFLNEFLQDVSPLGYVVAGYAADYVIYRMGADGAAVDSFSHPWTPVPLEPAERDLWQLRADDIARRSPGSTPVQIPAEKPAFRDLAVGLDGRIWVNRYVAATDREPDPDRDPDLPPELTWREDRVWDVFEPDGTFLGSVTYPDRTQLWIRRGMHLWGVELGEFDERYVVRYRIVPEGG